MIIGFGKTETEFEEAEERAIKAFAQDLYSYEAESYVGDEFAEKVLTWCQERGSALKQKAEEYKTAPTFPERYSTYWARATVGSSDLVIILSFLHYNRRHALSPDGWAVMSTQRLVHLSTIDGGLERKKAEAAE